MLLSTAQLALIKADIAANNDLNILPNSSDGNDALAKLYNLPAVPDFWVWRTDVSRAEIYNLTSPDTTTWNWSTYKAQAATEQNAWTQMFMGDRADFSKANLRAGVAAIFTGSAPANAQQAHILAMGRRKATRLEKVLATGTGSSTVPAVMGAEGSIRGDEVSQARNS